MGNHGLQEEVGSLAAAEILALETSSVIATRKFGTEGRAYVVLGSQVVVRIQLDNNNQHLGLGKFLEQFLGQSYVVLLLGVLHGLQTLVVHLQEILQEEIQGTLLAALVLPLPQPVHLIQQAILFQQVYLCPVQQLT